MGLLLRMLVYILVAFVSLVIFSTILYSIVPLLISSLIAITSAAVLANLYTLRIFERGRFSDIGLGLNKTWTRHLGIGIAAGALAGALTVLMPAALGLATWERTSAPVVSWGGFLFTTILLAVGVAGEELFFRGYGFQVALPALGSPSTLVLSALLFALVHINNPNVSALGLFNTFAWGMLLGWAVLRSGDLWLAIGLHAGWNWTLPLLGVNLSGLTMKVTPYDVRWNLPAMWSGGAYGPEGGLLCTLMIGLLVVGLSRAPLRPQTLTLLRTHRPEGAVTAT